MRGSTSLKAEKGRSKPLPKWAKAPKKPQKGVEQRWDYDPTPMALAVALFGGACGLIVGDMLHDSLTEGGAITLPWLPSWREHMALACFGVFSFVVSLFFLEVLSRRSKRKALKSTAPWLSVLLVTLAGTAKRLPPLAVLLIGALCVLWAYRHTRAIR